MITSCGRGGNLVSHTHNHNTITTLPINNDQMCLVEYEGLFTYMYSFPEIKDIVSVLLQPSTEVM